jgi:hypothetical protein
MTRRRKNNLETTEEKPAAPVGMEQVVVTKRFVQPIKEEPAQPQQVIFTQAPTLFPEMEEEDGRDKLESFLDRIDNEQSLKLRVDQLTEYRLTGRTGKSAPYLFCGEMPVSKDALDTDQYLMEVQRLFGGGDFRFTLRGPNGRPITNWVQSIKAGSANNGTPQQATMVQPGQSQAAQVNDGFDALLEQVGKLEKLKKMLGWQQPQEQPAAAAAPAVVAAPEMPIQERILEVLLKQAVDSGDKDTVDKLVDRIIGNDEPDISWASVVKEVAAPLLPVVIQFASNFMQSQAAPAQPQQAALPAAPVTVSQPPPNIPATPAAPPTPEQIANAAINRFLQKIHIDLFEGYPIEASVEAVFAFTEKYPHLLPAIQFLGEETVTPDEVLQRLNIPLAEERRQWIIDFREALKEDAMASDGVVDMSEVEQ